MYPPLEHIKVDETNTRWGGWRCRVPHCWDAGDNHGLCEFHERFANRQIGEPFRQDEDTTFEQRSAAYDAHREREIRRIPYHLIMASLWPGPSAEARIKAAKREKAEQLRLQEERDR